MIAYFDTSAIIPLLLAEPNSASFRTVWAQASRLVSATVSLAEGRAALALARRMGRLDYRAHALAVTEFGLLAQQLELVVVTADLAARAGVLAERHGLRGYDAVHLAAAIEASTPPFVVVTGDLALIAAATAEGLVVHPIP